MARSYNNPVSKVAKPTKRKSTVRSKGPVSRTGSQPVSGTRSFGSKPGKLGR
jgi:hypothetical protein